MWASPGDLRKGPAICGAFAFLKHMLHFSRAARQAALSAKLLSGNTFSDTFAIPLTREEDNKLPLRSFHAQIFCEEQKICPLRRSQNAVTCLHFAPPSSGRACRCAEPFSPF